MHYFSTTVHYFINKVIRLHIVCTDLCLNITIRKVIAEIGQADYD